jgi:ABC-type ATPase involved in cell division
VPAPADDIATRVVTALLEMDDVTRGYAGPQPLRIASFRVASGDRYVLSGLDEGAAETFVNLVTGAALPESGDVRVAGRSTREIVSDTDWLASLDRLGLVTARAVLIDKLPIAANMALPLTLTIDPMTSETRRRVDALGVEVGLSRERLDAPAATLTPAERVRVHLARALAHDPVLLLLEHPTAGLDAAASAGLGTTLRTMAAARGIAMVALSDDTGLAAAAGATRLKLAAATGALERPPLWQRILRR